MPRPLALRPDCLHRKLKRACLQRSSRARTLAYTLREHARGYQLAEERRGCACIACSMAAKPDGSDGNVLQATSFFPGGTRLHGIQNTPSSLVTWMRRPPGFAMYPLGLWKLATQSFMNTLRALIAIQRILPSRNVKVYASASASRWHTCARLRLQVMTRPRSCKTARAAALRSGERPAWESRFASC